MKKSKYFQRFFLYCCSCQCGFHSNGDDYDKSDDTQSNVSSHSSSFNKSYSLSSSQSSMKDVEGERWKQNRAHSTTICCNWFQMGKHLKSYRSKKHRDTIKLLLIGLDNAGKTTLALHLAGESVEDVVSTIGFSKYELRLKNNPFKIVLYDVGGSSRIRAIWKNYYSLVHGIVFVIDSSDFERIFEVKQLINELASSSTVSGKPILIYLNKQDIFEAMDEIDVCKFTNLDDITSKYKCFTKIVSISAKTTSNVAHCGDDQRNYRQIDANINSGLQWLLEFIDEQWNELNTRVEEESQKQISKEKDTMQQRITKIQQRNLIEVEMKVPKMDQKKMSNEDEPTTTNKKINIKPIEEQRIEMRDFQDEYLEKDQKIIDDGSEQTPSSLPRNSDDDDNNNVQQTTKPSFKRINKIYPSNYQK